MNQMRTRRGSAAILLTISFAGMIVLVTCLFAGAKAAAGISYADAALQTAGRSVISEYDTELLGKYGLFAFRGDERRIESDIAFYANASLKKDKTAYFPFVSAGKAARIFDIDIGKVEANLKEFSLMDTKIFEEQLRDAALAKTAGKFTGGTKKEGATKDFSDPLSGHKDRTLRNGGVAESLPSADIAWSFPDVTALSPDRLSSLADSAAADVLTSKYILACFGHANDGVAENDSFFDAEAEYILSGKMKDSDNYESVKVKLMLIRLIANNIAIYRDPMKMAQIEGIAAPFAAAAGIGEEIARVTIMEIWAGAETKNDIGLFEAGKNVAFLKSPAQWALTDGVKAIEGVFSGKLVMPMDKTGPDYEDYLRILLFLMDQETKLLRVMDLIQIDMKANYNREFLMREYYIGYRFTTEIGGERFEYTERY
jgi:hypothetical protein